MKIPTPGIQPEDEISDRVRLLKPGNGQCPHKEAKKC